MAALDFKPLSMSELRTRPGEVLDSVVDGESYVIERNGKQMACLVPLSVFLPDVSPARIAKELEELRLEGVAATATVNDQREVTIRLTTNVEDETFDITVQLPHKYPSACPRVYVEALPAKTPHRFQDGALCIFGMTTSWNPGRHSISHAVETSREWLAHYRIWRDAGHWPQIAVKYDAR